jgi:demethylmenaquinone methyltransferase/2-methoxy-6-polyprenyl-1,4-benzoquinol methylase
MTHPANNGNSIMADSTKKPKLFSAIESDKMHSRDAAEYRDLVRKKYDGLAGGLTNVTGFITGHEALAGRIIRPGAFDVRNCRVILDAGCGNGRYSIALRKQAPDAQIVAFDLSLNMLARARHRLGDNHVGFASADVTVLPFQDRVFDAAVCGWVLEHLPDPRPALREFQRVLQLGGKLLLMCTESTLTGALCSRLWHCRTYRRSELKQAVEDCSLEWTKEHWFTGFHRALRLGGIIVELTKSSRS